MKDLRPCESCLRHVFVTERTCPFCQTVLEPPRERSEIAVPGSASRAQRLALAAAIGSQGLLACAQTVETAMPVYGAPLAGNQAVATAGTSAPLPVPVYGLPLAGQPARAGSGGVVSAAYGAPPIIPSAPAAGRGGVPQPVYGAPAPDAGTPDEDAGDLD